LKRKIPFGRKVSVSEKRIRLQSNNKQFRRIEMVTIKSKYEKNKIREIESKVKSKSIYKKEVLIVVMALFIGIGCASTVEETAPLPVQETVASQPKKAPPDLSEKEKEEIDTKIEKLRMLPVTNLIENIKVTKGYEKDQSWEVLEEVLNEKLLILLKKEFPDSKDVLDLPIYDPRMDSYFNLKLKGLFMLYVSKNPDNGATITKEYLNLIRNKKEQSVTVMIIPPGARPTQEIIFKVYNDKLVLSAYRAGMQVNQMGYEYAVAEIISMLSLQDTGFVPTLKSINQKLVDSIK